MHPIITRAAALTAAAAAVVAATAAPASAAASRRSSDACTHNWSGPQVCIAIEGHSDWARQLTVTWTNPGNVKRSVAILHEGDHQAEVHDRMTGTAQGGKIVAEWTDIQVAWGKLCGSFADTPNVWACIDIHSGGPYSS